MHSISRSTLWLTVAAVMAFPIGTWGRQQGQDQAQATAQSTQAAPPATAPSSSQTDSLADAARKARERKKDSKPEKVFTNENIPTTGGISTVGSAPAAAEPGAAADAGAMSAKGSGNDEKAWRDKFAQLRTKLAQDKADLDVMQRELGVLDVQYYNDPVKAMQQGLTREDINKKTADIDAKKQAIVADQQAIDDAEDDLRKAGGDPGWSR
jgi:cytoskeletal protein RodZ